MTVDELLQGDPDTIISRTLAAVQNGTVKAEEVYEYSKRVAYPRYRGIIEQFIKGDYFRAQRQTLSDWLNAEGFKEDMGAYCEFISHAEMCQIAVRVPAKCPADFSAVLLFSQERVLPSPYIRSKHKNDEETFRRWGWAHKNQRYGWEWLTASQMGVR